MKKRKPTPDSKAKVISRTAYLGDIHGNFVAFMALVKILITLGVDRLVILGDIVGRGPEQLKCLEWIYRRYQKSLRVVPPGELKETQIVIFLGNHDEYFLSGEYMGFDPSISVPLQLLAAQLESTPADKKRLFDFLGNKEIVRRGVFGINERPLEGFDMGKPHVLATHGSIQDDPHQANKIYVGDGLSVHYITPVENLKRLDAFNAAHGTDIHITVNSHNHHSKILVRTKKKFGGHELYERAMDCPHIQLVTPKFSSSDPRVRYTQNCSYMQDPFLWGEEGKFYFDPQGEHQHLQLSISAGSVGWAKIPGLKMDEVPNEHKMLFQAARCLIIEEWTDGILSLFMQPATYNWEALKGQYEIFLGLDDMQRQQAELRKRKAAAEKLKVFAEDTLALANEKKMMLEAQKQTAESKLAEAQKAKQTAESEKAAAEKKFNKNKGAKEQSIYLTDLVKKCILPGMEGAKVDDDVELDAATTELLASLHADETKYKAFVTAQPVYQATLQRTMDTAMAKISECEEIIQKAIEQIAEQQKVIEACTQSLADCISSIQVLEQEIAIHKEAIKGLEEQIAVIAEADAKMKRNVYDPLIRQLEFAC